MEWIQPMEPISTDVLKQGDEWIHQIKWDGIRGMTYIDGHSYKIFTKNGRERTEYYPEFRGFGSLAAGKKAILDGEIVVLGEESKPAFHLSLTRERISNPARIDYYSRMYPAIYVIFDILYLDDKLLTPTALSTRREILREHVIPAPNTAIIDDFTDGQALFDLMKQKNWEGIVSKKLESAYQPAKHHNDWFKLKYMKKMLAALCGIQWKDNFPNSLILGIRQGEEWVFVGKASIGLTQNDFKNLKDYADAAKTDKSPFTGRAVTGKEAITWLEPEITCWVSFLEWTNDGVLRHPKIIGFSDKKAEEADGKEWAVNG